MKFRENEELLIQSKLGVFEFEEKLKKSLESKDITYNDITDHYGCELMFIFKEADTSLKEASSILQDLGVKNTGKNLDLLFKVVMMGDGDCPNCGGELEVNNIETLLTCKVCKLEKNV